MRLLTVLGALVLSAHLAAAAAPPRAWSAEPPAAWGSHGCACVPGAACSGAACPANGGGCPCTAVARRTSAPVQTGALVTTSGRELLPNGDGTYRYADDRPSHLPSYTPTVYSASGCSGGACLPSGTQYVLPASGVSNCPGGVCPVPRR